MVRASFGGHHGGMEIQAQIPTTDTNHEQDTSGARPRRDAVRRFKRSRDDRVLGGVCGGIAEELGIDPVIVRIATVALVAAVGVGAIAYVAAWILMPLADAPATTAPSTARPAHA